MARKDRPLRLGRGLSSLLGDDGENVQLEASSKLPVSRIMPGPFQPRQTMTQDTLDELTASIQTHGILQPILVRPSPDDPEIFQIIAGERRWRAAQQAGLHEVPVNIRQFDDASAMAASLIENLQRQDLNAIEEAEGLRRLMSEYDFTQEMVATSVGKSRSHVANTIRLLALPVSVQDDVRRGTLSAGHARALLSHADPAKAALAVVARGLNVRQTEALSDPQRKQPPAATTANPLLDTVRLEEELTATLGLRAKITFDGKQGQLSLHYRTLDQLDGLVRLLKPTETTTD